MSELSELVKRAKRFSTAQVSAASGLSMRITQYLFAGHTSVTLRTLSLLKKGVTKLEADAAKMKSLKKGKVLPTSSRDAAGRVVRGKGA